MHTHMGKGLLGKQATSLGEETAQLCPYCCSQSHAPTERPMRRLCSTEAAHTSLYSRADTEEMGIPRATQLRKSSLCKLAVHVPRTTEAQARLLNRNPTGHPLAESDAKDSAHLWQQHHHFVTRTRGKGL